MPRGPNASRSRIGTGWLQEHRPFVALRSLRGYHRAVSRRCPECGASYPDDAFFCGLDGKLTLEVQPEGEEDPRIGSAVGDYLLVARVADGAMGRVYEARHPESRQRVAIKVLHEEVARDRVAVERFKREFETAAMFEHPHIVEVLDFGETDDGSWFMTMEFLEGEELGERLRRDGKMPPAAILRMACQLALAMDHAHGFGVIHRDLKPDNVFLVTTPEGDHVKVLDFGSVKLQVETGPKLTAFGTTLGSPYYMSPEQAMGKLDVDPRTDVFAMAAILYEATCARVPFPGDNVAEILVKIVNADPEPPSRLGATLPDTADSVLLRALAKEKERRPENCETLAERLLRAMGLQGSVSHWAAQPLGELEAALAEATPRAPTLSTESADPSSQEPSLDPEPALPSSAPLAPRGKRGLLVAASTAALLVLGAAVWLLLR